MPLLLDLRHSLRGILKSPGFLVAATLSLALGIGVNTAAFSALQAGLAPRLAWDDPKSLVFVGRKDAAYPMLPDTLQVTYQRFRLWQERQSVLAPLAAFTMNPTVLGGPIEPRTILALRVSPEFWPMLGVRPLLGRLPEPPDEGVLVATHKLWTSALGADPSVVGKSFRVGGNSRTLVAVLPATAVWMGAEIFVPLEPSAEERAPGGWNFLGIAGRMRPGAAFADVQAAFKTMNAQLQSSLASERTQTAVPKPLLEQFYGRFRGRQTLLAWVAFFVAALACVNLCTLVIGRSAARLQELGIRQALGATRLQIFLPILSDLVLAAVPGFVIGCLFAISTGKLLEAFIPADFRAFHAPAPADFAVAAAVALLLTIIGAAIPALVLPRLHVASILAGARASGGRARRWTQKGLIAVQVGLAFTLLSSFALVWLSLKQMKAAPIGIVAANRILATLSLPLRTPDEAARRAVEISQAIEKIRALPGVQSAGATDLLPVIAGGNNGRVTIPGRADPAFTYFRSATDGYFESAGIPLVEGRYFTPSDLSGRSPAIIVSRSFARDYFPPGQSAVGRAIPRGPTALTIVGVVDDARMDAFSQSRNTQTIYSPTAVRVPRLDLVVKTAADPKTVLPDVRRVLRAAWPDVSLDQLRPLSDALDLRYAGEPRSVVVLMGLLAALAIVLTLAGIYGVLSRQVHDRRREMGIRLALGGRQSGIAALVVRQAMAVVAAGLLLGIGGALALGRALRSQLYEVKPEDPRVHLAGLLFLLAAALLACLVPALRAASVDPARALREE